MQHEYIEPVKQYLLTLQDKICTAIVEEDGQTHFHEDQWQREEGGGGRSRVLANGAVFEQAGVNFSQVYGATLPVAALPVAATAQRPELTGWQNLSLEVPVSSGKGEFKIMLSSEGSGNGLHSALLVDNIRFARSD